MKQGLKDKINSAYSVKGSLALFDANNPNKIHGINTLQLERELRNLVSPAITFDKAFFTPSAKMPSGTVIKPFITTYTPSRLTIMHFDD